MHPAEILADHCDRDHLYTSHKREERRQEGKPRNARFTEKESRGRDQADVSAVLSDPEARRAEHSAGVTALVPSLLRIGRRAMQDRSGAFASGQLLSSLCQQFSAVARAPDLWTTAGDILSEACSEGASFTRLTEKGTALDAQESPELRVLAYLGAAMQADPVNAFCAHISSIKSLLSWYPPESLTYRMILLPYVEDFWRRIVDQGRFLFDAPNLVVQPMMAASKSPEDRRVRAVLLAVRQGFLHVPVNLHPVLTWLAEK